MQTTIEHTHTRQEIELQRERDYYACEEATDLAERLGYPMDHTMTHQFLGGRVYDAKLTRIADYTQRSLEVAPSKFFGPNAFEVERQRIEHARTLRVEMLARGELDGNAIIEYSPIPDEVRDGSATLQGYRPDLMRDFVRIHYVEGDKVNCRLFSLDQTNPTSRAKVGEFLGLDLSADRSDREILADEVICTLNTEQVDELVDMTKLIHDRSLTDRKGGRWHAGSRFMHKEDALSIVYRHGDLLEEHMTHWSRLVGLGLDRVAGNRAMNDYRRKTAAAIDLRLKGGEVVSSSDSAVAEHANENNFDAYCPDGSSTTEKMAMNQGKTGEMKWMNCPFCGLATYGDPCASRLVCNACSAEVNNGVVVSKGIGRKNALAQQETAEKAKRNFDRVEKTTGKLKNKTSLGSDTTERTLLTVGGADVIVYRNGTAIAKKTRSGYSSL